MPSHFLAMILELASRADALFLPSVLLPCDTTRVGQNLFRTSNLIGSCWPEALLFQSWGSLLVLFGPLYYSQSCNIHHLVRWRIIHCINLNNISKVVSSQRVSLNAGQESFPQHGLLPFRRQSCSTVAAGGAPFGNHREMLAMVFSRARLLALLSWSSQILLCHVHARLSISTSAPRRLDVFLSSVPSFCASCERFWPYVLPATAGVSCCLHYSVSVGRHSVFRPR